MKRYTSPAMRMLGATVRHHLLETSAVRLGGKYNGESAVQSRRAFSFDDDDEE